MKNLSIISAVAAALALATTGSSTVGSADRPYTFHYENVLGTSLELKVLAASPEKAHAAETAVLNEIEREAKILSTWDANSEVSRWIATHDEPVKVSSELFEVLGLYDRWRARTNGALNASAETAIRIWKSAAKANKLPSQSDLTAAVTQMKETQWTLDAAAKTATHTGNAPLVFASFTKSYIIDRATEAAMKTGVSATVLNIGGDVAVRGTLTEPVEITDPRSPQDNAEPMAHMRIRNLAIATSGDYKRGVDIAGKHFSHIIDPRTAQPAGDIISSTVVAPNPADAGALATAFSILTPAESAKLAASMPGVAYLLVKKNGEQVKSGNWKTLEAPIQMAAVTKPIAPRANIASAGPASATWDPSMELTVNFELPTPPGAYKRPFVAIWIEDADRFQVKTMALWYHEDRFLTEMKQWYRSDRLRAMSEGKEIWRTLTQATRPPGKYSLKWDGKDNDGKPVKPGKYTVYLETVREHGTYAIIKQQMDFSGTPKVFTFPANSEVAAASFDYHKLAAK